MPDLPRRTVLGAAALSALAGATAATQSGGSGGGEGYVPLSSAEQAADKRVDPNRPLAGKVALVTGGARGIGHASALELARLGADVAVVDIVDPAQLRGVLDYRLASRDDLAESKRQIEALGVRAFTAVADVRRADQLARAVAQTLSALGNLDILVAVAGINLEDDTLASYNEAKWTAIVETNVHGVLRSVQAALPGSKQPPGGNIVSSLAGRRGSETNLVYSTSKWAVTGLMKCLAAELGPQGIAVNAVAPSGVDTVLYEKGRAPAVFKQESAKGHVLPVSILAPVDIARAVGFLAGPGGDWMSGSTIDVNAGRARAAGGARLRGRASARRRHDRLARSRAVRRDSRLRRRPRGARRAQAAARGRRPADRARRRGGPPAAAQGDARWRRPVRRGGSRLGRVRAADRRARVERGRDAPGEQPRPRHR